MVEENRDAMIKAGVVKAVMKLFKKFKSVRVHEAGLAALWPLSFSEVGRDQIIEMNGVSLAVRSLDHGGKSILAVKNALSTLTNLTTKPEAIVAAMDKSALDKILSAINVGLVWNGEKKKKKMMTISFC
jgi:hypothetical protein